MVVQHNLTAMNSNRMLGITTGSQAKATEKLSSGYKINRAADDAAGLAISEKMRKQIRGLTQASANAQDGISAVQTAEGALGEVHDMLQRMNELAVKAANGTMSESDRNAIQSEVNQLVTEIDRVAITTKFNETYLLKGDNNGEVGKLTYTTAKTNLTNNLTANGGPDFTQAINTTTGVAMHKTDTFAVGDIVTAAANKSAGKALIDKATAEIQTKITTKTSLTGTKVTLGDKDYFVIDSTSATTPGDDYATVSEVVKAINDSATNNNQQAFASMDEMMAAIKADHSADIKAVSSFYDADATVDTSVTTGKVALKIETFADMNTAVDLSLHVGADSSDDNKIRMNIAMMSARGLGVNGLKISGDTADNATRSIDTIADALQKVSNQRASLGAIQNRLEHTIANLDNVVENTQAAESQIRDTDMATQMVTYSNNQILAQAGQAMLAQSNQANQGVLSLLG